MSETGYSLRDALNANDAANAARFQAIYMLLEKNERDRRDTEGDHEDRIRTLEKRGILGHIADGALLALTIVAGALGWKTQAP